MDNKLALIIIYSCALMLLFAFSAFFSSADMAFGSVSELRLESYYKNNNDHKAKIALKLVKNYDNTISAILFLNDLVNVASETIAALLGYAIFEYLGLGNPHNGSLIGSGVVLVIIIVFGEILPKSLTKSNAFKLSLFYAPIINGCYHVFFPIVFLTTKLGKLLMKPFKKRKLKNPEVTDEELEEMVNVIEKEGVIDKENADILRGTIDYASTEAFEIMTPRVDIYAIDIEDDINEIFEDSRTFIHSRIPVYRDTIDNIIGFVTTKDLIRLNLAERNNDVSTIIKSALKFPRSAEINGILQEFKRTKTHFAIILDEYGGVEGIVTMEDILEEIVGEIWDEVDDVNEPVYHCVNGNYIIDGSMNLNDFFDLFDIDKDDIDTEYVTIGGYCVELLNDRFAKVGDVIYFHNIIIKVIAVDDTNTISKIQVKIKK